MAYTIRFSGGQFGNFEYGAGRMAGQAFDPKIGAQEFKDKNDKFVYNQQEFVKNQQTSDSSKLGTTTGNSDVNFQPGDYREVNNTTSDYDYKPYEGESGGGENGGSTFNTTNNEYQTTNTSTTNTEINNNTNIDQKIDQGSEAEYNMGDYNSDNSFNNNTLGDYAEMNVFQNQYGGDVKSINIAYNGEGAQMKATPIRDLTMAGAFEVSDSPAKTAGFIGKYTNLNRANQSSYGNTGVSVASKYMDMGRANKAIDTEAMDRRTSSSPLYHEAKSRVEGAYTFGDRYAQAAPDWDPVVNEDPDTTLNPRITDQAFGNEDDDNNENEN